MTSEPSLPPVDRNRLPGSAGPLQAFAMAVIHPYFLTAYRIRGWGRLPRKRGATLAISNHQHDLDTTGVIMNLSVQGPWSQPIFAVTSRRLFEPGFMSARRKWLEPFVRTWNWGWIFRAIGMLPMENEPRRRPVAAFAYAVYGRHPEATIADAFGPSVIAELRVPDPHAPLTALFTEPLYHPARDKILSLAAVREPYRSEIVADMRKHMDEDMARIEDVLRGGGTLYLTPEGHYTTDGRMIRFKMALGRLAGLGKIYTLSVSYDPFVAKRLSMLYRVQPILDRSDFRSSLAAPRAIVVSQLLAEFLLSNSTPFTESSAIAAVRESLTDLPKEAFIDPELAADPARMVRLALPTMTQLGLLKFDGDRYHLTEMRRHPQFPDVADIIAHQSNHFHETIESLATLTTRASATPTTRHTPP
jgi:1-acyl-sn-glycerol-3-phosphate acyltransferase